MKLPLPSLWLTGALSTRKTRYMRLICIYEDWQRVRERGMVLGRTRRARRACGGSMRAPHA